MNHKVTDNMDEEMTKWAGEDFKNVLDIWTVEQQELSL